MSVRKSGQVIAGTPNITTGHHVGEIFWTSRLDNELNGAVEANGATYSVEEFTGEKSVPALLADGKLPFVSMAEYESIVSANGSCRAWGWDNGDTFRVPTLKDVYLMAGQAESAGEFISESLPNISGACWGSILQSALSYQTTGAFKAKLVGEDKVAPSSTGKYPGTNGFDFNASWSSSSYQDGAKVRPDSVRYRAMVQLSTGVQEDATQLKEYKFNNPHFFGQSMWSDVEPNNASWLLSNGAFHSGATYGDYYEWLTNHIGETITFSGGKIVTTEGEYTDYDWVVNTADQTFRLPIKVANAPMGGTAPVITGEIETYHSSQNPLYFGRIGSNTPLKNQNTYNLALRSGDGQISYSTPETAVGSNPAVVPVNLIADLARATNDKLKLYFYVGDVVQDANLINAGGVLSDVADSIKRSSAVDRETVVGWGMPDYSAGISVSSGYTAPKNGWVIIRQYTDNGGGTVNIGGGGVSYQGSVSTMEVDRIYPISKGQSVTGLPSSLIYYPCKGV